MCFSLMINNLKIIFTSLFFFNYIYNLIMFYSNYMTLFDYFSNVKK